MRAVLTYHSIDDTGSPISVSPGAFRAHCEFLASGRVSVLPVETLLQQTDAVDAVAITFDDGFTNTATVAAPLLSSFGLTATVFVVPAHVGAHNDWGGRQVAGIPHLPLMGWEALAQLRAQGWTIGGHTMHHTNLGAIEAAGIHAELEEGDRVLAAQIGGGRPTVFAYPYGGVSAAAADAVRERYVAGLTTELRVVGAHEDRALIPRLDMYYFRDADLLKAWGSPAFRARLWTRHLARRARAWLPTQGRVA